MITQTGYPKYELMPVYNPIVFYFTSDNIDKEGFRYYIDVKDPVTDEVLFSKTIMPDFQDDKAVVHLDRELSDFVSYDLDLDKFNSAPYHATKSYIKYKLEVGEEYFVNESFKTWEFNQVGSYQIAGSPPVRTFCYWSWNTSPIAPEDMPTFNPGDTVTISYNNPADEVLYPGTYGEQVVKMLGTYALPNSIAVVGFVDWPILSPTNVGGTITYNPATPGKKRKRFKNLLSTNEYVVFNGVFNTAGWLDYNMNDYLFHVTYNEEINLLSVLPRSYKLRTKNHLFVNYFKWDRTTTAPKFIDFTNDTGTTRRLTLTNNTDEYIMQVNIGTSRLNFGTHTTGPNAALLTSTTKWYDVNFKSESGASHLDVPYRIYIDQNCPPDKEYIEMLFLDQLGSFLPYNFLFKHEEKFTTKSEEYTKYLGDKVGNYFTYDTTQGGEITYNKWYSREFTLKTEFLTEAESRFFQNVVKSPVTVIKVDGEYQRCTMKTKSMEIKKNRQLEYRRYEVVVELSNKDKINI